MIPYDIRLSRAKEQSLVTKPLKPAPVGTTTSGPIDRSAKNRFGVDSGPDPNGRLYEAIISTSPLSPSDGMSGMTRNSVASG